MKKTKPEPQVEQVEPVAISQEQQAAIALANLKNLWRCPRWGDAVTLPDCPGIIALAKITCSSERGFRVEGSDDISHKRMAKVAEDIAHKILSACGFMKFFIMAPSKDWLQISGKQTQLNPIFQQAMPIWGGIWFRRIKYCMYPMIDDDLDTLRNWIDAFLPTHAPGFSERLWNPWQNHIKIMKQRWSAPNLLPWPEAFQHFWNLEKSGQYLGMLQTKIQNDDGKAPVPLEKTVENPPSLHELRVLFPKLLSGAGKTPKVFEAMWKANENGTTPPGGWSGRAMAEHLSKNPKKKSNGPRGAVAKAFLALEKEALVERVGECWQLGPATREAKRPHLGTP